MGNQLVARVLIVGLDNSGKSSILHAFETGRPLEESKPTTSFSVKDIENKGAKLSIWDVAGKETVRNLWKNYYEGTNAVVWVVDSTDEARLNESKNALAAVVSDIQLKDAVFLVMANKQDAQNALSPDVIKQRLDLENLAKNHMWHVQGSSAKGKVVGINEGLSWVNEALKQVEKRKKKEAKGKK